VPRFSANLHFLFTEVPFLDRFAAARAAGFAAVEFPDPFAHPIEALTDRLQANGLSCVLFNLPMGAPERGEKGLAALPDRIAEYRAGVDRAVGIAGALGCPRVHAMAGIAPAGVAPAVLRDTLIDNLRYTARAFRAAGVTVCLEAINRDDVPGYLVGSAEEALALIEAVAEDNVRFQLDIYHMHKITGDAPAALRRLLPHIEHIQFADAPGRHEPGTGVIPFPEIFRLLDEARYPGWVGAEYHPTRPTATTLGWRV
jgi:hydroxypyruvate isomerase